MSGGVQYPSGVLGTAEGEYATPYFEYILPPTPPTANDPPHFHSFTYGHLFKFWLNEEKKQDLSQSTGSGGITSPVSGNPSSAVGADAGTTSSPSTASALGILTPAEAARALSHKKLTSFYSVGTTLTICPDYFIQLPPSSSSSVPIWSRTTVGSHENHLRYDYHHNEFLKNSNYLMQLVRYDNRAQYELYEVVQEVGQELSSLSLPSDAHDGAHYIHYVDCATTSLVGADQKYHHPTLKHLWLYIIHAHELTIPDFVYDFTTPYLNVSTAYLVVLRDFRYLHYQMMGQPKSIPIGTTSYRMVVGIYTSISAVLHNHLMGACPDFSEKICSVMDENPDLGCSVYRQVISHLFYNNGKSTRLLNELQREEQRKFKSLYPQHPISTGISPTSSSNYVPFEQLPYAPTAFTKFIILFVIYLMNDFWERLAMVEQAVMTKGISPGFVTQQVLIPVLKVFGARSGDIVYKSNKQKLDAIGENIWSVANPSIDDSSSYGGTLQVQTTPTSTLGGTVVNPALVGASSGSPFTGTPGAVVPPSSLPSSAPVTSLYPPQPIRTHFPSSAHFASPSTLYAPQAQVPTYPSQPIAPAMGYVGAVNWLNSLPTLTQPAPHQPPAVGGMVGGGGSQNAPPLAGNLPHSTSSHGAGYGGPPFSYSGYGPLSGLPGGSGPPGGGGPPGPPGSFGGGPPLGPPGSNLPKAAGLGNNPQHIQGGIGHHFLSQMSSSGNGNGNGNGNNHSRAKFDPQRLRDVKPYSAEQGDPNYATADDFLKTFEEQTVYYTIDDETKIHAFGTKLVGMAKTWYEDLGPTLKLDYLIFRNEFWKHCTPDHSRTNARDAFYRRRQEWEESSKSFYSALRDLRAKANRNAVVSAPDELRKQLHDAQAWSDRYKASYYASSTQQEKGHYLSLMEQMVQAYQSIEKQVPGYLSDQEVRNHWRNNLHTKLRTHVQYEIDESNTSDMETLINRVSSYENLLRERNESTHADGETSRTQVKREYKETTPSTQQAAKKKPRAALPPVKPRFTCWNCGESGHSRERCPNARIAAIGSVSDITGNDPEVSEYNESLEAGIAMDLSVPGLIGERYYYRIHLDSCATVNVLSKGVWDKVKEDRHRLYGFHEMKPRSDTELTLISQKTKIKPYGFASHVPVRLGYYQAVSNKTFFLPFYIVDGLNYNALIGFRMWKGMIRSIDMRKGRILLEDGEPSTYVRWNTTKTHFSQRKIEEIHHHLKDYIGKHMKIKKRGEALEPDVRFGQLSLQERKESASEPVGTIEESSDEEKDERMETSSAPSSSSSSSLPSSSSNSSSSSSSSSSRGPTVVSPDEALEKESRRRNEEKKSEETSSKAREKHKHRTIPKKKGKDKHGEKRTTRGDSIKNKASSTQSSSSSSSSPSTSIPLSSSSSSSNENQVAATTMKTENSISTSGQFSPDEAQSYYNYINEREE